MDTVWPLSWELGGGEARFLMRRKVLSGVPMTCPLAPRTGSFDTRIA